MGLYAFGSTQASFPVYWPPGVFLIVPSFLSFDDGLLPQHLEGKLPLLIASQPRLPHFLETSVLRSSLFVWSHRENFSSLTSDLRNSRLSFRLAGLNIVNHFFVFPISEC